MKGKYEKLAIWRFEFNIWILVRRIQVQMKEETLKIWRKYNEKIIFWQSFIIMKSDIFLMIVISFFTSNLQMLWRNLKPSPKAKKISFSHVFHDDTLKKHFMCAHKFFSSMWRSDRMSFLFFKSHSKGFVCLSGWKEGWWGRKILDGVVWRTRW